MKSVVRDTSKNCPFVIRSNLQDLVPEKSSLLGLVTICTILQYCSVKNVDETINLIKLSTALRNS